MTICIIPARSGSKRIKNKNIKLFDGKPIISYAIRLARSCGLFKRIIVSTDSYSISKIAKKYGAEVPFLRPKKYATDKSSSAQALKHAVNFLEKKEKKKFDIIVELMCTNPLKKVKDIDNVIRKLIRTKADTVIAVHKIEDHAINFSGIG